jgi:hypothetical protein
MILLGVPVLVQTEFTEQCDVCRNITTTINKNNLQTIYISFSDLNYYRGSGILKFEICQDCRKKAKGDSHISILTSWINRKRK